MNTHPLQQAIEKANTQGRKAVIPFITAGFPDKNSFWDILRQIDQAGVDIIEVGIPFSDPVADGPVIENASREAIDHGVTLSWIMDGLKQLKGSLQAKLVLMGYANPFMQYGINQLVEDSIAAGISGFIIPDVPLEEAAMFTTAFDPAGLALITIVSPNTTEERMKLYARSSQGFVYLTSVLGTTGGEADITGSVAEMMRRARSCFAIPLALGFGLRTPDQLTMLPSDSQPDAAIIGSALLTHIHNNQPPETFFKPWLL